MKKKIVLLLVITMIIVTFVGCTKPQRKETKPIIIASITFTEHIILTEILKIMIEENLGYKVEHIPNMTTSNLLHKMMINNEVDVSVRYTGTEFTSVLGSIGPKDARLSFTTLRQEYGEKFQQTVFEPLGFENTYAFAVRKETALQYNLKRVSDLEKHAQKMKLGTDNSWVDRKGDGSLAFTKLYGFSFSSILPIGINLVYKALQDKRLDAALVYSTDPRIQLFDLQLLEDDRHFFPPYQGVVIARSDTLEKYTGLREELLKLSGQIDQPTMVGLNYRVEEEKIPPTQVAREFLKKKHLIK